MTSTWPDVHYKKLTVPAWVECDDPSHYDDEFKHLQDSCKQCNGDGGKWHEAVVVLGSDGIAYLRTSLNVPELPIRVTKSTILYQLYDPCTECGGDGKIWVPFDYSKLEDMGYNECKACLKDNDGNPTGAAEDTKQGWKIEKK